MRLAALAALFLLAYTAHAKEADYREVVLSFEQPTFSEGGVKVSFHGFNYNPTEVRYDECRYTAQVNRKPQLPGKLMVWGRSSSLVTDMVVVFVRCTEQGIVVRTYLREFYGAHLTPGASRAIFF